MAFTVSYNVSCCGSLNSSELEFNETLGYLYSCLPSSLGSLQPLSLQIFTLPLFPSLFSFWHSQNAYVVPVPMGTLSRIHPSSIFFSLYSLDDTFHCPILKSTDYFDSSNLPLHLSSEHSFQQLYFASLALVLGYFSGFL